MNPVDTASAVTATKTYTAEDIRHGVFYPFSDSTVETDLPNTAWLMAASKHLSELTGMNLAEAVENMAHNQGTALDARAKSLTFFEVAEYAAQHEEM